VHADWRRVRRLTFDEAKDVGGEGSKRRAAGALHHGGPRHPPTPSRFGFAGAGETWGRRKRGLVLFLGFYNVPCAAAPLSRAAPERERAVACWAEPAVPGKENGPRKRPLALSLSPHSSQSLRRRQPVFFF